MLESPGDFKEKKYQSLGLEDSRMARQESFVKKVRSKGFPKRMNLFTLNTWVKNSDT